MPTLKNRSQVAAEMEAQFQLQNYQNLMQFVSNIMRIMGDVSKSIVSNIR